MSTTILVLAVYPESTDLCGEKVLLLVSPITGFLSSLILAAPLTNPSIGPSDSASYIMAV